MRLILATGNADKVAEFQAMWPELDVEPAPEGFDPEETGTTLLQNAWIKAGALAEAVAPGTVVMADDSGLAVNALGGRPGVFSSRYAGANATYADNCRRLLQELDGVADRRAAFACVLVALGDRGRMWVASGCCPGVITASMRGEGGFGYDPLFRPEGHESTMAEMTRDQKAAISHRGRAARAMERVLGLVGG